MEVILIKLASINIQRYFENFLNIEISNYSVFKEEFLLFTETIKMVLLGW
jgi:hypothetical protein